MKKILSLLTLSLVIVSCTPDDINPEQNFADGNKIVGFPNKIETISYFADEGQVTLQYPISLIGSGNGETLKENIDITYEIVAGSSTATQGVEYDLPTTGTITMTAGSTFAYFPIKVNTGLLNPTGKTTLRVKLSAATNNTVVGKQYEYVDFVFVGCRSLLVGNYSILITWNNGANTGVRNDEVISSTSVNNFRTKYVGGWASSTFGGIGYDFIDICGEITLKSGLTLNGYSNKILPATDNIPNDGAVTSPTEFNVIYDIVPYPGLDNRVYRNYYTKL